MGAVRGVSRPSRGTAAAAFLPRRRSGETPVPAGEICRPGAVSAPSPQGDCRLSDMAGEKTRGAPKKQAKKPKAPSTHKAQRQAEAKKARQQPLAQ